MADLIRIPGVELIRTGKWPISSGSWDATPEDLAAAVAALNCPSIRRPVLKLGHVDPRFDGEPAIGYVDNLRITDGGHTLVGDYAGVPQWLGNIAASAYPDRSIEGTYGFRCQQSHTHPFVLTAVALLGVTPPGVGSLKSLQDVAALYGVDPALVSASGVKVVAKVSDVEASKSEGNAERLRRYWLTGKGALAIKWGTDGDFDRCVRQMREHAPSMKDPKGYCAELHHEATGMWPGDKRNRKKVAASTDSEEGAVPSPEPSREDLIRSAFNASQPQNRWIVEINESGVVVIDDTDRSLHRIPVEVGDTVTFGESTPVHMAYVPLDSELVSASRTVFASRAESRPDVAATVLDTPQPAQPPPNPTPPVEPPNPAVPPDPTEEPQTPPQPGGVPVSGEPAGPQSPGAEPVTNELEGDRPVSTLSADMRSRLGLADDADEAAALAAIDALKVKAETPPEPNPEQVAASAAAARENEELRQEVKVLASQVESMSSKLAATEAEKAASVKASVLGEAQRLGKFKPADREQWEKDYDDAPAVVTRTLARIAAGAEVPVVAAGYTGTGEEPADAAFDKDYETHFRTEKAGA